MKFARPFAVAALLGVAMLLSTGCSSSRLVRMDMTNAADSTARDDDQDRNDYARVIDNNTRGIWDDLARLMLVDRSSRLTPFSVP